MLLLVSPLQKRLARKELQLEQEFRLKSKQ
jgi:hypothetical protein